MRKIAIYCRVSTDEQAKNKEGSITSQIQRLRMKSELERLFLGALLQNCWQRKDLFQFLGKKT